jgi:membrane associated rhomboid family serine protease
MMARGLFVSLLALDPVLALGEFEIWRLMTYPLAVEGFGSVLVASFIFYFFAPEVEQMLGVKRFLTAIGAFVALHGLIFASLFASSSLVLNGPDMVALVILSIFTYVYPKSIVNIFGIFTLESRVLARIVIGLAIIPDIIIGIQAPEKLLETFATDVFSVVTGFAFAHAMFNKYSTPLFDTSKDRTSDKSFEGSYKGSMFSPDESDIVEHEPVSYRRSSRFMKKVTKPKKEEKTPEERLNDVLDKISAFGKSSLTQEEQEFLKQYSEKL